jgi:exonuclease III
MEGKNFHILSINSNGLDREKIEKLTKLDDFDILYIQETLNKVDNDMKEQLERKMDCIVITKNANDGNVGGVAMLIKNKIGVKWERVEEGVFLRAD